MHTSTHAYLGLVLALEDVAGTVWSLSDQAAEAAGLLAVVDEFSDLVRSTLKQHRVCERDPRPLPLPEWTRIAPMMPTHSEKPSDWR